MQLVLPVKEGKRPLSFHPAKLASHRMGRRFWRSAKTHTARELRFDVL